MAFKNRLLATVAVPLIAFTGMPPVSAAELLRPAAPIEAQSLVIKVQADDDQELLKQQKKERRENRKNQQGDNAGQAQQTDQEQVKPRRKKQNDDAQMQDNSGQQIDQEQVKPRRKKQQDNAADEQQMQQDNAGQAEQTDQEQVKPRRKKQNDNAASDQNQQGDEQLKNAIDNNNKKHRKQNAADEQQMQQDNAGQAEQTDQEQVKPRRKKQQDNAADDQQMQQDNAGQAEQNDEEQVKPRRKNDNANSDQNQSTDDKLKNAIDNNKRKHNKNQDQAEQPADNNDVQSDTKHKAERPVDVKKAKDVAADPSKTTDTVVLPVENGAAVLDSDKDADNSGADRNRRKREREEVKQMPVPKSDKDAQRGFREDTKIVIKPVLDVKGERIAGFKGYDDVGGRRVGDRDNRVVINVGGKIIIRSDDDRRIARNTEIRYERLPNNLIREVVVQANGDRIVTVRNRYGEIVRRSRIERDNREVLIFYSPELAHGRDRLFLRDPGADLPPMRLRIPVSDYIIDVSGSGGNRNYEEFLEEPPVEQVERVYSVGEVKNSARIRDKMRRIDLDTITFETGSADVADDQVQSLKQVGNAIKDILDKDPGETFLIEGHTDAVGSDESNLVLSDQRAESIANVLSEAFDIPAENLVTQGYGERFLKIDSDGPVRENRRVTIRRITPLVRPLESAEK